MRRLGERAAGGRRFGFAECKCEQQGSAAGLLLNARRRAAVAQGAGNDTQGGVDSAQDLPVH